MLGVGQTIRLMYVEQSSFLNHVFYHMLMQCMHIDCNYKYILFRLTVYNVIMILCTRTLYIVQCAHCTYDIKYNKVTLALMVQRGADELTHEGPERHISCLARHYFAIARKMLWSCMG